MGLTALVALSRSPAARIKRPRASDFSAHMRITHLIAGFAELWNLPPSAATGPAPVHPWVSPGGCHPAGQQRPSARGWAPTLEAQSVNIVKRGGKAAPTPQWRHHRFSLRHRTLPRPGPSPTSSPLPDPALPSTPSPAQAPPQMCSQMCSRQPPARV